jgi:hypothetical protein
MSLFPLDLGAGWLLRQSNDGTLLSLWEMEEHYNLIGEPSLVRLSPPNSVHLPYPDS